MSNSAYDALIDYVKTTSALEEIGGILGWDQEVMMPRKGNAMRADQMAALEATIHARRTATEFADLIGAVNVEPLGDAERMNVSESLKTHDRATKIPAALATEIARVTSGAQQIWADARAANSYADFAPTLEKVLDLRRQEAACLSDGDPYDALLDDFEPGMTSDPLLELLTSIRPGLTELRGKIADKGMDVPVVTGLHSAKTQMAVAHKLADAFDYDWDSGRLDLSVHPFSSGGNNDSRITTRVSEDDVFNCFYSTIHEVGHSRYEQNMPLNMAKTPAGKYASMGVHESQSRMAENQIGRSREFTNWMFPLLRDELEDFNLTSPEELYRAANRVETGFIRTEADEVHYNLHVLLRFELERAMVRGDLQVADLEGVWNETFKRDFGVDVPDAAHGVLQDVHWSIGLFGYFPTYSLGNIYAGELYAAMRGDIPDLDAGIVKGDTSAAMGWVKRYVHDRAHTVTPEQIISDAVGHKPTGAPLLAYLEKKFGEMYDI